MTPLPDGYRPFTEERFDEKEISEESGALGLTCRECLGLAYDSLGKHLPKLGAVPGAIDELAQKVGGKVTRIPYVDGSGRRWAGVDEILLEVPLDRKSSVGFYLKYNEGDGKEPMLLEIHKRGRGRNDAVIGAAFDVSGEAMDLLYKYDEIQDARKKPDFEDRVREMEEEELEII